MLAKQDAYINSAYQHLQVISQDKQKRLEYEARQKAILDYNQGMKEATERGEQRGRELIARNMIAAGFSVDDIIKLTGLTMEQVESLK